MWTILGTAILLGAWVLAKAIGGTIAQIQGPANFGGFDPAASFQDY